MFKGEWDLVIGDTSAPDPDTGMAAWPTITVFDFEIPEVTHGQAEEASQEESQA